jgi:hypothetical protein
MIYSRLGIVLFSPYLICELRPRQLYVSLWPNLTEKTGYDNLGLNGTQVTLALALLLLDSSVESGNLNIHHILSVL